ncbi:MAG: hypothetical protein IPH45_06005 [Bacteroidales bacterium]|nr:hypothetical protein [Bacteroidales bacterium]
MKQFQIPLIVAILIILLSPFSLLAEDKLKVEKGSPGITILSKRNQQDSAKINQLIKLAHYQIDHMGDSRQADSLSELAIMVANGSYHTGLLFHALIAYLENNDLSVNNLKARNYANQALELSRQLHVPILEWTALCNLAQVFLADYEFNKALTVSYKALALAGSENNTELKTESFLLIGRCLEGQNQKIEAFRNYLNAVGIAESVHNDNLLKKCYSELSGFFNLSKIYDKASYYKIKESTILENEVPVDSLALMWTYHDLQVIDVNSNNNRLHENNMQMVLDFAIRHQNKRLLNYQLSLYRSHLIEANKIDVLYKLYTTGLKGELGRLQTNDFPMYLRLQALFCEQRNMPDSALYYFRKAELMISNDPNKIMQSNFYHRFGQFLVRKGNLKDAIVLFGKSYKAAEEASYFDYMLDASNQLEELYSSVGDFENAFKYSTLHAHLSDSLETLTKTDQMLMLEIDHESKQREQKAIKEYEEVLRRHNIQYTAITIIIFAVFVLLIMLGSFRVPSWVIKMLGFFSFIFLFEFIIMIADHKIYEITSNEPWKILAIKIGLIAFLLPFHHWIEKKLIHYLLSHKLIDLSKFTVKGLMNRNKQESVRVTKEVE